MVVKNFVFRLLGFHSELLVMRKSRLRVAHVRNRRERRGKALISGYHAPLFDVLREGRRETAGIYSRLPRFLMFYF